MQEAKPAEEQKKEEGKVFLRTDLQKALLKSEQITDTRKLTHWARG